MCVFVCSVCSVRSCACTCLSASLRRIRIIRRAASGEGCQLQESTCKVLLLFSNVCASRCLILLSPSWTA